MLKNKVILILLDGCRYDTAVEQMGFLGGLVEKNQAQLRKVLAEVPSNSRPLYETLLTGRSVYEHQIYTNMTVRLSKEVSIFDLVKEQGGVTACAGYYWLSELYNHSPYQVLEDRIQHDLTQKIQHGIFYHEDCYPDSHVLADAQSLIQAFSPDFLMVHTMNIDDSGHKYTCQSQEYVQAVNRIDGLLAYVVPIWQKLGYNIIVTADHGMDEQGLHGGMSLAHREVPFFLLNNAPVLPDVPEMSQLEVMPFICQLLGVRE